MKTSELIKELTDSLAMNGDLPIHTILNGKIDTNPTINVGDGIVYIEGVVREDEDKIILTADEKESIIKFLAKIRTLANLKVFTFNFDIDKVLKIIDIQLGLHN